MALTKAYTRMITGVPVSIMDYGAVSDGSADCSAAFNAAISAGVRTIYVPEGTYLIQNTVELPSNMVIYGDGISSVIESNITNDTNDDQVTGLFCAKQKDNIIISKLKMVIDSGTTSSLKSKFIDCTNVSISNCQFDGTFTGNITGTILQIYGSDDFFVENCKFYNSSLAILIARTNDSTGTISGTVRISNSSFINLIPSSTNAYPVSIYAWWAEKVIVSDCYFEGMDSTNTAPAAPNGYYYFSGDGNVGKSQLVNCTFVGKPTATINVEAVRGSESTELFVSDCNFTDFSTALTAINSERITIQDCYVSDCGYGFFLGNSDGSIHKVINNYFYNLNENAIVFGTTSGDYGNTGEARNNTIINCDNGGIFFKRVNFGIATNNTIVNANRDNNPDGPVDVQGYTGIAFYPVNYGYVDGNRIQNTPDSVGHCKYGIGLFTSNMEVQITRNNYFDGLEIGAVKNPPTAAPGSGTWLKGSAFDFWNVSPGGVLGKICTTSGTSGTLSGVTGSITSGTTSLVVNDASNLAHGQHITISGVTGTKIIVDISGTTITIDSNADATVSSAAVAYSAPVFKDFGSIAS